MPKYSYLQHRQRLHKLKARLEELEKLEEREELEKFSPKIHPKPFNFVTQDHKFFDKSEKNIYEDGRIKKFEAHKRNDKRRYNDKQKQLTIYQINFNKGPFFVVDKNGELRISKNIEQEKALRSSFEGKEDFTTIATETPYETQDQEEQAIDDFNSAINKMLNLRQQKEEILPKPPIKLEATINSPPNEINKNKIYPKTSKYYSFGENVKKTAFTTSSNKIIKSMKEPSQEDGFFGILTTILRESFAKTKQKFPELNLEGQDMFIFMNTAVKFGGFKDDEVKIKEFMKMQLFSSMMHHDYLKAAKYFSATFQKNCQDSEILTGNENATKLVGMRLKRLPEEHLESLTAAALDNESLKNFGASIKRYVQTHLKDPMVDILPKTTRQMQTNETQHQAT